MKKLISLIISSVLIISLSVIPVFSSEEYALDYFMVVLKEEYSSDSVDLSELFSCDKVKEADIISEEDAENTVLVVWLTEESEEVFSEAYDYFSSHSAVDRIIKDVMATEPAYSTEEELYTITHMLPFDIDGDGRVSASDARVLLRASVGLETISILQKRAAGVDTEAEISANEARMTLRASVGLEDIPQFTLQCNAGSTFAVGPLMCHGAAGYYWEVSGAEESFSSFEKSFSDDDDKVGDPVRYYFVFSPEKSGEYTLTFSYKDARDKSVVNEFTLKAFVN